MKKLLEFIITKITGSSDFEVEEVDEDGHTTLDVKANPEIIGLIIGKEGKTIKNIRKIVSLHAVRQDKSVHISVTEK